MLKINPKNHSACKQTDYGLRLGRYVRIFSITVFLAIMCFVQAEGAEGKAETVQPNTPTWSSPLLIFQRIISRGDGNRCPMYPSCSQYAATAFKEHTALTAWILTCDRLLRCGHSELHFAPKVYIKGKPYAYDPLFANTFWWQKP